MTFLWFSFGEAVYIIRDEVPLLWVEYDENDEALKEGDVFVIQSTLDTFQVDLVIPMTAGGVILGLRPHWKEAQWPKAGDRVTFFKESLAKT